MMQNSKLLLLLSSLSTTELNRFQKFVDSPYFNADERLAQLYRFLRYEIKQNQLAEIKRESLFHHIWPEKPFSYAKINQLLTELKRLLDRFLALEHWQKSPLSQDFALLQLANERNWDHLYQQALRRSEKHLDQELDRPEDMFFQQYQLAKQADHFAISRKDREPDESLEQALIYLQAFSLQASLKHVCELLNRQHILQKETQDESLLFAVRQIEAQIPAFQEDPYIYVYGMLMRLLLGQEEEVNFRGMLRSI